MFSKNALYITFGLRHSAGKLERASSLQKHHSNSLLWYSEVLYSLSYCCKLFSVTVRQHRFAKHNMRLVDAYFPYSDCVSVGQNGDPGKKLLNRLRCRWDCGLGWAKVLYGTHGKGQFWLTFWHALA